MGLIWLGHIIGDFYLQSNKVALRKQKSFSYMLLHLVIYTVIVMGCFAFLCHDIVKLLGILLIVFLSHFIIDFAKIKCFNHHPNRDYILFIVDQLLHVSVLFFVYIIFNINSEKLNEQCFYLLGIDKSITVRNVVMVISSILFCAKPAAILIYKIISAISIQSVVNEGYEEISNKERMADKTDVDNLSKLKNGSSNKGTIRTGCWIGILEREIILFLGLLGQFGAIGFVLTAKSLARFKQLEDKDFAEKYIVGTLLSSLMAIVCIFICKLVFYV